MSVTAFFVAAFFHRVFFTSKRAITCRIGHLNNGVW
jgi:hypothetical protein